MKKAETALLLLISIAAISINLTSFPVEAQTANVNSAPTDEYFPPIGISFLSPMNNATLTTNSVTLRFTISVPSNAYDRLGPVSVNMINYFLDGNYLGTLWTHHDFSKPFSVNLEVPDGKHGLAVIAFYEAWMFHTTTAAIVFTVQTQPPSSTPIPSSPTSTPAPTPTPIPTPTPMSTGTSYPTTTPTPSPSPSPTTTQQTTLEPTQLAQPTVTSSNVPNWADTLSVTLGIAAAVVVAVTIVGLAVYSKKYKKKKTAN
jgi:hypothetical protein